MIKASDLDSVKLANPEYFADEVTVLDVLERAFQQGSQSWGVRQSDSVFLSLARDLRSALEVAESADENRRMLKGAQLETGRLKKKIEKLEAELMARDLEIKALSEKAGRDDE